MKYVGVTKSGKIRCTRKDGQTKDYKAKTGVVSFAKDNFKKDDIVIGEFEKGILTKLSKIKYKKNSYNGGTQNNFNKRSLDFQSAVKSASQALTGIEGVTESNYEEIYKTLINIGLQVITGQKTTIESQVGTLEEDTLEETEKLDEIEEDLDEEELE